MLVVMVFLWVASYAHGQRRMRFDGSRMHLLLPRSGAWLHRLKDLEPAFDPQPDLGRYRGAAGVEVVGLAKIKPGIVWSLLTQLSWDQDAQRQYFRQPRTRFRRG